MRPAPQIRQHAGSTLLLAVSTILLLLVVPQIAVRGSSDRNLAHRRTAFSLAIHSLSVAASSTGLDRASPEVGLAIADFTGDTHPDLATVQLRRIDSSNAQYSIKIRLTEGSDQVLTLAAPFGGLAVTPKDVTGDGNLDLVVRSSATHNLVAVFLNDGAGHFRRADNELFPAERGGNSSSYRFEKHAIFITAALGCPESHGVASPQSSPRPLLEKKPLPLRADLRSMSPQFPRITSNRAPPSLV
jgi:hypothetical protein